MAHGDSSGGSSDSQRTASTDSRSFAAEPLVWLSLALAGFVIACIAVAVEAYRHNHGADAEELISFSSPAVLVAAAGMGMVAIGLLVAASVIALRDAPSDGAFVRRGALLLAAWSALAAASVGAFTYLAAADVTIGNGRRDDASVAVSSPSPAATIGAARPMPVPGASDRVTLSGTLTLDGAAFDSRFLGVRVMRDGLATACQVTIPAVTQGRYEVQVAADAEIRGCGAPGAEVLLWVYVDETFIFSTQTVLWLASGANATFDGGFSTSVPFGAASPVTQFKGLLFDREGERLPGGTVIEAYVGEVRCGVTSLRYSDDFENLYTLAVAGPESVSGCAEGAEITFRLDGAPAAETAVNDPGRRNEGSELNLTLR